MNIGFMMTERHLGHGGLETVLLTISKELKRQGHTTFLYMSYPPKFNEFTTEFDHVHCFWNTLPSWIQKCPSFITRPSEKWVHRTGLAHLKDDLDVLCFLDFTRKLIRCTPFLQKFKKHSPKTAIILYPHGTIQETLNRHLPINPLLSEIDGVLAISDGIAAQCSSIFPQNKIHTIYNPIPTSHAITRNSDRKKTHFLYIGRMDSNKRILEMLDILHTLTGNWHIDIIGKAYNTKYDKKIRQKIKDWRLEHRITLHGWQDDPWSIVKKPDILWLHSLTEGFPLVLPEAMERGIPCVSANCPTGPGSIITNDVNGWLYDVHDETTVRQILQDIIDNVRPLPPSSAVRTSIERFHTENVVTHMLLALSECIQQHVNSQAK